QRIIRIINNRAVPAVQVLPPLMPGYDKEYKGYVFDVAQAKKLLAEAGYPSGFSTVLYANNTDPNPRIAQAIQQDLAAIGIKAELKTLAQSTVIEAGGTKGQAPLLWSGGMAWIADYPDPNDFYWPILSCASLSPGTWNWAWYCNQRVEKMVEEADALVQASQAAAREAKYRDIYRAVMQDAPWIPIFLEKRYTMHTVRIGGWQLVAMYGQHPGVRAASRRFPRAIPAPQQLRGRGGRVRPRHPAASAAVPWNDRRRSRGNGTPLGRATPRGRRQHGYPRSHPRVYAAAAGEGARRAVLGRRHACRAGRRRSVRHSGGIADGGYPEIYGAETRQFA